MTEDTCRFHGDARRPDLCPECARLGRLPIKLVDADRGQVTLIRTAKRVLATVNGELKRAPRLDPFWG